MTSIKQHIINNKLIRNRHFWVIALITLLLILFYNASYLHITGWFTLFSEVVNAKGIYAFIVSFLFLIPILYSSIVFKIKGTLIAWIVFLISVIPRAIIESTSFEYILIVALFSAVALLIGIIMALEYNREIKGIDDTLYIRTTRWHSLARVLKIREYERQYLARRLHDNIIQSLLVIANLAHGLESGEYGIVNQRAKKNIGKLQTMVLHVIDDVRQLSYGLRPSVLDNIGLLPILRWQAEKINNENNIKVDINVTGIAYRLPSDTEMIIYRILQEALNNICKHSHASEANISLDFTGSEFKVSVTDNGCGFVPPDNLSELSAAGMSGLHRITEQARLLDGKLLIQSASSKGTVLTLSISM